MNPQEECYCNCLNDACGYCYVREDERTCYYCEGCFCECGRDD